MNLETLTNNLVGVMGRLASKRPIFHSEADFQHALAWELHEVVPDAQVRLEYRVPGLTKTYVDIWVNTPAGPLAIELKYATRRYETTVAGEQFDLNNHGAQDLRRYDYLKDIVRIERVASLFPGARAAAIFLTNDDSYWRESLRIDQIDSAFRIHEGRLLQGELAWGAAAGIGTTRGRTDALGLKGTYPIVWRDYSQLQGRAGQFRYLVQSIGQLN